MKTKHYTQHATDKERMENRPKDILLEDLEMLVKYWGDESVKVHYIHFSNMVFVILKITRTRLCNLFFYRY